MIRALFAVAVGAALCSPVAWAQPAKKAAGRARAAAVQKPATVKVTCPYADMEFDPNGTVADVVDRAWPENVLTTVGDLKASPKAFVISWERAVNFRTERHRYNIERETGRTTLQKVNDFGDGSPILTGGVEHCTMTR